jgi:transglutaminase-like putative cysteine protease
MMIAVKMLEEKRSRDYCQIAAMSALTIISVAVESIDGTFLYYCVLVSVLAGFQFILAAWFDRGPDCVLSGKEARQTVGMSLAIWLMMLPLCVVLFIAAPRARVSLSQMQRMGGYGGGFTGFSNEVSLGSVRRIQEDGSLAFRAKMPMVAPRHLFWRGIVLERFDGRSWSSEGRGETVNIPPSEENVRQEIFMESRYLGPLFALDIPVFVDARGAASVGDGVFLNTNYRLRLNSYTAFSSLSDKFPRQSERGERFPRRRYLALPDGFSPRVREIALGIASGLEEGDVPEAVMSYLSPPLFSYTMEELPVSGNPLEEFVLTSRKGNCEYFAAAMAVMLRMAGVPSRLVAGYHGGIYNDGGGYYIVNQSNAHVWVEAWNESDNSWRRYDPTPFSNEAGGGNSSSEKFTLLSMYIDLINYRLSRIFLEYEGDTQSQLFAAVRDFFANPAEWVSGVVDKFSGAPRKTRILAAIFLASIIAAAAGWRARRARPRPVKTREDALRRGFLAAMRQRGFEKRESEGLEEFVESIRGQPGSAGLYETASEFVTFFEGFYFGERRMDARDFTRLEELTRRVRKEKKT